VGFGSGSINVVWISNWLGTWADDGVASAMGKVLLSDFYNFHPLLVKSLKP
jgi:hypothetical protein